MGTPRPKRVRVGIVAIPEAGLATLSGIFDVLNSLALLAGREGVPDHPPFDAELLGETADDVRLASRVTLPLHGAADKTPARTPSTGARATQEPGRTVRSGS